MSAVTIKKGLQVIANGKLAVVCDAVDSISLKIRYSSSGAVEIVLLESIEFIKSAGSNGLPIEDHEVLENVSEERLSEAGRRFDIISKLKGRKLTMSNAAIQLGITKSHLYKLMKQHDEDVGVYSLLIHNRGRQMGTFLLSEQLEDVIKKAVGTFQGKGCTYSQVYRELENLCVERNLKLPSRGTLRSRINMLLSNEELFRAKEGAEAARDKFGSYRGKFETLAPLELVQMDHTLVDVMLLSNDRLHVIGRPWLTIAIDIHTRVILGYYLSLHVPSALSVACTLTHAVFPKTDYLLRLGLGDLVYPFFGIPKMLHMDNAAEFTANNLIHACNGVGIKHKLRPIGRKHFGGHVERLIGTLMISKVHLLKGTTMSNAVARRGADSEKNATMTFQDFSVWFAREVNIYHSTIHSELKKSPKRAWEGYFKPTGMTPFPTLVDDPLQFKLRFMPEESRTIQPEGVLLFGKLYWDPILKPFYGQKNVQIKYDPFSMRQIWIKIDGSYSKVGYSNLTEMDLTYEEYRASKFYSSPVLAGTLDDPSIVGLRRDNQALCKSSAIKKKTALRQQTAQGEYQKFQELGPADKKTKTKDKPDYSKPPTRFRVNEDAGNE
jgi:putative transposase